MNVYNVPVNQLVRPFNKIQLLYSSEKGEARIRVHAYIPVEPSLERVQTALVLDGSASMLPWYGRYGKYDQDIMSMEAVRIGAFLASRVDVERQTILSYMATGEEGRDIEEIGVLVEADFEGRSFSGPKLYGSGTQLLPIVRHFVESYMSEVELGLCVILTDGKIQDSEAVGDYTHKLVRQIQKQERPLVKFVLVGIGDCVDEQKLSELDNLTMYPDLDLWDFRLARDLKSPSQIFTELVLDYANRETVAEYGYIMDVEGRIVVDYRDSGVPTFMDFELPLGAEEFALYLGDDKNGIVQPLRFPTPQEQVAVEKTNSLDNLEAL
jgi:hypothetical protein